MVVDQMRVNYCAGEWDDFAIYDHVSGGLQSITEIYAL